MRCNKDNVFVIVGDNWLIEKRKKDGTFIASIACHKCLPELKEIIRKFEKQKLKEA